ncbi:unnamed protein product [Rhizoctonia solani]|uniref:Uncharacterized protein n=2 Tax=Rhizoctonia solani TaxID=456999 RepID=A0A8H3AHR1_9AGAM|nr:unnamed protein product [Rhizoctonia solani]CAE6505912.1 unnamed protein product [Rhizoctonia solani]
MTDFVKEAATGWMGSDRMWHLNAQDIIADQANTKEAATFWPDEVPWLGSAQDIIANQASIKFPKVDGPELATIRA